MIDDISSRIRTITSDFGDELKETDYEVLDINHDAPAKVVSTAIVSPQKVQYIMTREKPLANASDLKRIIISESDTQTSEGEDTNTQPSENEDTSTDNDEVVATLQIRPGTEAVAADRAMTPRTKRFFEDINTDLHELQIKQARTPSIETPKTPIVGQSDTQDQDNDQQSGEENEIFKSIADKIVGHNNESSPGSAASVTIPYYNARGGKRLNKRQSKQKSQKRNQKNKTKRISYIKNKQTRKNKHSKKTKSKRSNKK